MKIYQTIRDVESKDLVSFPGIYYFRNKVNNKYYIGQAICIRKRFREHILKIKNGSTINPLYKAVLKYGIDNFEYAIIGVFRNPQSQESLKKKLDKLEKFYIKEYNSYGVNGYNQTLGGDGGILGYKMTEEQKEVISKNSKNIANDGRNNIFVYDIIENKEYKFSSIVDASIKLNIKRDIIYSAYRRRGIGNKRYILAKTKEELYNLLQNIKDNPLDQGHFKSKITLEEYSNLRSKYSNLSLPELAKLIGVCKKTVYNYEHKLNEIHI